MPGFIPLGYIFPSIDLGANVGINLKTGETVRGMLLRYDIYSTTVQPCDAEGNFCGNERVIQNSEQGLKINNRYQLLKGL